MKQLFTFLSDTGASNDTYGALLSGTPSFDAITSGTAEQEINLVDGNLRDLTLTIDVAPGGGGSTTFTVQLNGVDTALVLTFSGATVSQRWTGADLAVADGDILRVRANTTGSPTGFSQIRVQFEIESTAPGESQYHGNGYSLNDSFPTVYIGAFAPQSIATAAAAPAPTVVPTNGTITKLAACGQVGAGAQDITWTIFKDSGSGFVAQDGTGGTPDTRVHITGSPGPGSTVTGSTTFVLNVVAGDVVYVQILIPSGQFKGGHGLRFVADIDGESILASTTYLDVTTSGTDYLLPVDCDRVNANATEGNRQLGGNKRTAYYGKLFVLLSASPGSSKTHAFTARLNGVDTLLTTSITGSAVVGFDVTNSFTILDGDLFAVKHVATGSPAGALVALAIVQSTSLPLPPPPVDLAPFDGGLNGGLAHAYVFDRILSALEVARRYTARLHGDLSGDFLIQRVRINAFEAGEGKKLPIRDVEAGSSRDADLTDLVNPTKKEQ